MGSFYANVTVVDVDIDDVRRVAPRPCFLVADGAHVVVFAEADALGELVTGAALTASLGRTTVGAGVHDDDLLFWSVRTPAGGVAEGAVPDPAEVFGAGEPGPATDVLAAALASMVGRPEAAAGLQASFDADHVFASDLHAAVVEILGLAPAAVGWGYSYLAEEGADRGRPPAEHLPA